MDLLYSSYDQFQKLRQLSKKTGFKETELVTHPRERVSAPSICQSLSMYPCGSFSFSFSLITRAHCVYMRVRCVLKLIHSFQYNATYVHRFVIYEFYSFNKLGGYFKSWMYIFKTTPIRLSPSLTSSLADTSLRGTRSYIGKGSNGQTKRVAFNAVR